MSIPATAQAVFEAVRFTGASTERVRSLYEPDWQSVLKFCDRSQLTLTLGSLSSNDLPPTIRDRIENDASKNARKFAKLTAEFLEIAGALEQRGIDFVVLKGFTHSPDFTADPLLRAQGDIDLWCQHERVHEAHDALIGLGYAPYSETENRHLPPLKRPSTWEWRGDFYDPEMPIGVDLHFQLWDNSLERIAAPGLEDFWHRRVERCFAGRRISALHKADCLAFAALHLLLHILRGDVRLQRAWEIGGFLHRHSDDTRFWSEWTALHPEALRRLETVIFRMCAEWFGCELSPRIREEISCLPRDVDLWFKRHAFDPVENLFTPNKNELWLHLSLLESFSDRASVLRRRIVPIKKLEVTGTNSNEAKPEDWRKRLSGLAWTASRVIRHVRATPPTVIAGVRWWWLRQGLGAEFLRFQAGSTLGDIGVYVFYVLYNLYLMDLGFKEDFLGLVTSANTAGTLAGAIPAAALARRIGLRNTMVIAMLGGACAGIFRVLLTQQPALICTAFLSGVFTSLWAVSIFPAVAGLSNEKNRGFAFSLMFSIGIGVGVLGGVTAGRLATFLSGTEFSFGPLAGKRIALLAACAVVALAAVPLSRLRLAPAHETKERKIFPRTRFVLAFLIALFVFTFASDLFNPFFNAFLSTQVHLSVERIGVVFSLSHFFQVCAVMMAPAALRRFGEVRGIALMQFVTAIALAGLAVQPAAVVVTLLYPTYMAFQNMCDPGVYSMLMGRVGPHLRNGASALNFLVTSLAGMLAALVGGFSITRYGYPSTMVVAACLLALAAILFRALIRDAA